MYFLTIVTDMFQTFDFAYVECCEGNKREGTQGPRKKIKNNERFK